MEIDPQLVRDLFAGARNMQNKLHSINTQCFALKGIAGRTKHPLLIKAASNVEHYTEYIYKGEDRFPDVAKTLEAAREALRSAGEWKEWSDYIGFYDKTEKREGGAK